MVPLTYPLLLIAHLKENTHYFYKILIYFEFLNNEYFTNVVTDCVVFTRRSVTAYFEWSFPSVLMITRTFFLQVLC